MPRTTPSRSQINYIFADAAIFKIAILKYNNLWGCAVRENAYDIHYSDIDGLIWHKSHTSVSGVYQMSCYI